MGPKELGPAHRGQEGPQATGVGEDGGFEAAWQQEFDKWAKLPQLSSGTGEKASPSKEGGISGLQRLQAVKDQAAERHERKLQQMQRSGERLAAIFARQERRERQASLREEVRQIELERSKAERELQELVNEERRRQAFNTARQEALSQRQAAEDKVAAIKKLTEQAAAKKAADMEAAAQTSVLNDQHRKETYERSQQQLLEKQRAALAREASYQQHVQGMESASRAEAERRREADKAREAERVAVAKRAEADLAARIHDLEVRMAAKRAAADRYAEDEALLMEARQLAAQQRAVHSCERTRVKEEQEEHQRRALEASLHEKAERTAAILEQRAVWAKELQELRLSQAEQEEFVKAGLEAMQRGKSVSPLERRASREFSRQPRSSSPSPHKTSSPAASRAAKQWGAAGPAANSPQAASPVRRAPPPSPTTRRPLHKLPWPPSLEPLRTSSAVHEELAVLSPQSSLGPSQGSLSATKLPLSTPPLPLRTPPSPSLSQLLPLQLSTGPPLGVNSYVVQAEGQEAAESPQLTPRDRIPPAKKPTSEFQTEHVDSPSRGAPDHSFEAVPASIRISEIAHLMHSVQALPPQQALPPHQQREKVDRGRSPPRRLRQAAVDTSPPLQQSGASPAQHSRDGKAASPLRLSLPSYRQLTQRAMFALKMHTPWGGSSGGAEENIGSALPLLKEPTSPSSPAGVLFVGEREAPRERPQHVYRSPVSAGEATSISPRPRGRAAAPVFSPEQQGPDSGFGGVEDQSLGPLGSGAFTAWPQEAAELASPKSPHSPSPFGLPGDASQGHFSPVSPEAEGGEASAAEVTANQLTEQCAALEKAHEAAVSVLGEHQLAAKLAQKLSLASHSPFALEAEGKGRGGQATLQQFTDAISVVALESPVAAYTALQGLTTALSTLAERDTSKDVPPEKIAASYPRGGSSPTSFPGGGLKGGRDVQARCTSSPVRLGKPLIKQDKLGAARKLMDTADYASQAGESPGGSLLATYEGPSSSPNHKLPASAGSRTSQQGYANRHTAHSASPKGSPGNVGKLIRRAEVQSARYSHSPTSSPAGKQRRSSVT